MVTAAATSKPTPAIKAVFKTVYKPATPDSRRKALLAQIHIVRKQLVDAGVMDDDGYREALRIATISKYQSVGKDSLKLMTEYDLKDSLRQLRKVASLHNLPAYLAHDTAAKASQASALERKLWALWYALGRAGKLSHPTDAGLRAFVKHRTDVDHPRWCTDAQLHSLIEQVKKWDERYDAPASPAA